MISDDRIREMLDHLAGCFENETSDPGGWGQFLDVPRRHIQVGVYGTAAGLIALALAERGADAVTQEAAGQLSGWWQSRMTSERAAARVVQNVRLGFVLLAMRLTPSDACGQARDEIQQELLSRILPSGLWGEYWSSAERHDQTPRLFTSALILLAFGVLRDTRTVLDVRLHRVADQLETRLAAGENLSTYEAAVMGSAVLNIKGTAVSRRFRGKLARVSRQALPDFDAQGVHFFDYEYIIGTDRRFGRDYFIVPIRIVLALAGLQQGAPSGVRLFAERAVDLIVSNMAARGGMFSGRPSGRISTVDQAWVALFLRSALGATDLPGPVPRLWYEIVRIRRSNWFFDKVFPIAATVAALALSTAVTSINRRLENPSLTVDVVATVGSFLIGAIYGPRFIQRLLPGRE